MPSPCSQGEVASAGDVAWEGDAPSEPSALSTPASQKIHVAGSVPVAESLTAVSGTSQKLLQLLRKRLRQLLRVTFVLAICLALAATAFAIWWLTSLNGLPDIGDPFDVAAFRAFSVPDDQNAFTFLRRASEKAHSVRPPP